jgi:hypothetical protein
MLWLMEQFPHEFEALLSPAGREVLSGAHPAAGALARDGFLAQPGLLEPTLLADCRRLLAEAFTQMLRETSRALPPANSSTESYEDTLPKVGRLLSVPMDELSRARVLSAAQHIGLMQMLESASFRRFSERLAGRALGPLMAGQVLANRPGDYAGPHTDHHPEDALARDGYVDVHLTFCSPGVREQFIVYQRDGHLSAMAPIAIDGTVTAYRLPLWHYTTPLQTQAPEDRRWLVLGTFPFAA